MVTMLCFLRNVLNVTMLHKKHRTRCYLSTRVTVITLLCIWALSFLVVCNVFSHLLPRFGCRATPLHRSFFNDPEHISVAYAQSYVWWHNNIWSVFESTTETGILSLVGLKFSRNFSSQLQSPGSEMNIFSRNDEEESGYGVQRTNKHTSTNPVSDSHPGNQSENQ